MTQAGVVLRRALGQMPRQVDVAAQLQRTGGGRVLRGSGGEIVRGGIELAALVARFAALQIPEHGVGLQPNRVAEGREGGERVAPAHGQLAAQDALAVQPLATGHRVAVGQRRQPGKEQQSGERAFHFT